MRFEKEEAKELADMGGFLHQEHNMRLQGFEGRGKKRAKTITSKRKNSGTMKKKLKFK